MKTENKYSLRGFFMKEPKFSVLIALAAILLLLVLFLTVDISTISPFSVYQCKEDWLPGMIRQLLSLPQAVIF